MQPNNVKDKYVVAIFQEGKKRVIGYLPLEKSRKFAKTIFYFLKSGKENMKVPSLLLLIAEENFIDILKERLPKLL